METLIFVLGTLSGLFLIGMVYAFVGVLKTSKQIVELQNEVQAIITDMDSRFREYESHADYLANEINQKEDRINLRINKDFDQSMLRMDEISRYIDSRLDKTVDALCLRMDTLLQSGTKSIKANQTHLSK
jgi:hypothetical protein